MYVASTTYTSSMPVWQIDHERDATAVTSQSMPCDTPSRLPLRSYEHADQHRSSSPSSASSPTSLQVDDVGQQAGARDVASDESISVLDPRRFTPTLHASLVSEILNLRRSQEENAQTIQMLESTLHESQRDAERLTDALSFNGQETRSLKRQLALLEGGTSSVMEELTIARDKAAVGIIEVKSRLDAAQKRIRALDDDSKKVHEQWARDKDDWQKERRKYERKIHSSEARVRGILEEVAAFHVDQPHARDFNDHAEADNQSHDSGLGCGSDTASIESTSMTNTTHFAELGAPAASGVSKPHGISLADELDPSDEDGEIEDDHQVAGVDSKSMHSTLNIDKTYHGRESTFYDANERLHTVGCRPILQSIVCSDLAEAHAAFHDGKDLTLEQRQQPTSQRTPAYVDVEVQCSLPQVQHVADLVTMVSAQHAAARTESQAISDAEGATGSPEDLSNTTQLLARSSHATKMASTLTHTTELPLSPPLSPRSPLRPPPPPPISNAHHEEIVDPSTQSEPTIVLSPHYGMAAEALTCIPSISVHPPTSRPTTPRKALLQQHVKDFGCQVFLQLPTLSRSVSVQTEEILVDRRLHKLPAHLKPSFIHSNPPSPKALDVKRFSSIGSYRALDGASGGSSDVRDDMEDDGEPSSLLSSRPVVRNNPDRSSAEILPSGVTQRRCPERVSSLFAGFDGASSDEADDFVDMDLSDNDCSTALSAPRPRSSVKKYSMNAALIVAAASHSPVLGGKAMLHSDRSTYQISTGRAKPVWIEGVNLTEETDGSLPTMPRLRQGALRRSMLVANGTVAQHARSRSPSLPNLVVNPPFPIPTRASSRQPPSAGDTFIDNDKGSDPRGDTWSAAKEGSDRYHHHINSLRKVRSAAAIAGDSLRLRRHRNLSPPPASVQTDVLESPRLPFLPAHHRTAPHSTNVASSTPPRLAQRQKQSRPVSLQESVTDDQPHLGGSHQNHVVDAIAQTMVGEWMFKYVRKRKSFGMADPSTVIDGESAVNGTRHRRWVWLAPYERAVMWSSKQPSSGSALLGKSGRKLPIQSVLDVKDDNPPPKGVSALFTRSILILTPARALKITASNRERHYVWLSALSFLAHSNHELPSLDRMLQAKKNLPPVVWSSPDSGPVSQLHGKRRSIRNSIRVAKGTDAVVQTLPMIQPLPVSEPVRIDDLADRLSKESFHDPVAPGPANAPVVPRFIERDYPGSYGRKRSHTASRALPPSSYRGLPVRGPRSTGGTSNSTINGSGIEPSPRQIPTLSSAEMSFTTHTSRTSRNHSGHVSRTQSRGQDGVSWDEIVTSCPPTASSIHAPELPERQSRRTSNFFDAVGTMRMEAFITPTTDQFDDFLQQEYGYSAGRSGANGGSKGMDSEIGSGNGGGFDELRAWKQHDTSPAAYTHQEKRRSAANLTPEDEMPKWPSRLHRENPFNGF